ncbi:uncharacterized protein [Rutidosis leptorrhynchoides]|uniref:uncharacterized protein n=1 Tax=Rutidosis leptorrhynchoides TaxID=125765 RepID=UPI003A99104E
MENDIIARSESSLGLVEMIKESFKTIRRNRKLLCPILIVVFISFCQLDFAHKYVISHVSKDLIFMLHKYQDQLHNFIDPYNDLKNVGYTYYEHAYAGFYRHTSKEVALDDVRRIFLVELLIMSISSIVTLVFLVTTVSSSYEAYTAKVLDPKDIFLKLRKTWKRPIVTSFYMFLLTLGIAFFIMICIGVNYMMLADNHLYLLTMFLVAITLSLPVCYFYVVTLWNVSLVVSVLEEGSSGPKAIGRALELMKGKRLQASLVMVLFAVAYGLVALMANVTNELALMVPFTNGLYCLLNLLMLVVYTVFYHQQKTSLDEKDGKSFYLPIAAGEA